MKAKELESGNQTKHYVVSIDMGSPGSKEKESKFAWCDNGENREGNLDIDKLISAETILQTLHILLFVLLCIFDEWVIP